MSAIYITFIAPNIERSAIDYIEGINDSGYYLKHGRKEIPVIYSVQDWKSFYKELVPFINNDYQERIATRLLNSIEDDLYYHN